MNLSDIEEWQQELEADLARAQKRFDQVQDDYNTADRDRDICERQKRQMNENFNAATKCAAFQLQPPCIE